MLSLVRLPLMVKTAIRKTSLHIAFLNQFLKTQSFGIDMKFGAIKNIIGSLAPTLGQALAGPLGGTAAAAIASVLGCSTEPKVLEKAVQNATPEQLAQIKRADNDFKVQMKQLDVDVFALQTADTQDARKFFNKDWTARIIAVLCVVFFGCYIFMVTIQPPDANSDAVINLVLGYLGGIVSSIISYYFGSSDTGNSSE